MQIFCNVPSVQALPVDCTLQVQHGHRPIYNPPENHILNQYRTIHKSIPCAHGKTAKTPYTNHKIQIIPAGGSEPSAVALFAVCFFVAVLTLAVYTLYILSNELNDISNPLRFLLTKNYFLFSFIQ